MLVLIHIIQDTDAASIKKLVPLMSSTKIKVWKYQNDTCYNSMMSSLIIISGAKLIAHDSRECQNTS